MQGNPFSDLFGGFGDAFDTADSIRSLSSNLFDAAQAFVKEVKEQDTYCEERIYPAALAAKIEFARMSRIPVFHSIEKAVEAITTNGPSQSLSRALANEGANLGKMSASPKSSVFRSAIENYKSLGHSYKGPQTRDSLKAFIDAANKYSSFMDAIQEAMENLNRPPQGNPFRSGPFSSWPSEDHKL